MRPAVLYGNSPRQFHSPGPSREAEQQKKTFIENYFILIPMVYPFVPSILAFNNVAFHRNLLVLSDNLINSSNDSNDSQ